MNIKEKVAKCLPICGTHINLSDPTVTEMEAQLGYDFLWVDMEHTRLSCDQVHAHLLAARAGGTPMFVRVPVNDLTATKRVLEMGIDGIVFPMAENCTHVKELLSWTLYPPYGKRGCGPRGAVRYGLDSEAEYYGAGHLNSLCRFIQIEQKSAAEEAEEIAKLPYLDGCVLGMHDLSGSVGDLGNIFGKQTLTLAKKSIAAFAKQKKTVGVSTFSTAPKTLKRYHEMGINMISTGADYEYILKNAAETLKTIKRLQGGDIQ